MQMVIQLLLEQLVNLENFLVILLVQLCHVEDSVERNQNRLQLVPHIVFIEPDQRNERVQAFGGQHFVAVVVDDDVNNRVKELGLHVGAAQFDDLFELVEEG